MKKRKVQKSSHNTLTINRYSITISNRNKILFPRSHITKGMLIDYYTSIAPLMIPYTKNRPLSMQRFPQGINHEGFFQKDIGAYFPAWIKRIPIATQGGKKVTYVVCNSQASIVYLANQACITLHLWLSRIDKLNYPDRLIFDLDPADKTSFTLVKWAASTLQKLLEELGLSTFALLTGSRGMHVIVPLKRVHTYDVVRTFAHDVATVLVNRHPDRFTIEMHKEKRKKHIFIDWLRNGYGATAVAPYSVRPHEKAPVATPIAWQELSTIKSSQQFTIKTILRRIHKQNKNPWHNFEQSTCTLKKAQQILHKQYMQETSK